MKEITDILVQVLFLVIGLGIGVWLLYYAFRSPRKSHDVPIDTDDLEIKRK